MLSVSVVIPVRDGERHLGDLLKALRREEPDEVLVIDSGSSDRSREIAREGGAELIEIEPADFGHGRTRNLGAERTTGELICFLTQDAEPVHGWLGAYRDAFGLGQRIGAAYGPHLPRKETSPMIARELTEFFAGFSPDGAPVVERGDGPVFLSNVNACYRRDCWAEIRFPDVPYAEDQAFARAMLAAGWRKAFHPQAAVLHAHDYGAVEFMRRYFDEYRGLREALGHVEPMSPRSVAAIARHQVAGDWRWMSERGWPVPRRAGWAARSVVHHAGRQIFAGLGSRAERLPVLLRRTLSLERRDDASEPPPATGASAGDLMPRGRSIGPTLTELTWSEMLRLSRDGPALLLNPAPGMADHPSLHFAVVIPPFSRGSGGHASIFQLVRGLERMGHTCSIWLFDPIGRHVAERPAVLRRRIVEEFVPLEAPVFKGFDDWYGADVVVATGWETAFPTLLLEGCQARAYLVHDHEPEFFAMSAEAVWAEQTYSFDLYPISASTWLRDLVRERYGREGSWFRFGVDHGVYRPRPVERRRDTVMFYARYYTPRRAVPLGLLALHELWRRRPDIRIVLFGAHGPPETSFPYEFLGIVSPEVLARRYSEATVGICLSLTNYSLVPQEMMACGLPCVDLAGRSPEAVFGRNGPVEFAEFDPLSLADAAEALLTDEERWAQRSNAGLAFVADATWDLAAVQVERGLRDALREREKLVASGAAQA
jgi:glycosyltransferase involved in cell wall biosynthesis/GT2 family glycosyltransferase